MKLKTLFEQKSFSLNSWFGLSLVAAAGLLVPGANSWAGCSSVDNSSCWNFANHSGSSVSIVCNGNRIVSNLDASRSSSIQYDRGWGDGMGYPQPGIEYRCDLDFSESRSTHVSFTTIDWGDRVQFNITNGHVTVKLRQYWGKKTETYESSE